MKNFVRGLRSLPVGWQLWVLLLVLVNMAGVLFVGHREAQIVLVCLFAGGATGTVLFHIQGFTKLLGLMHFPWLILIPYLWGQLPLLPAGEVFGIWIRVVIGINSLSIVIDAIDVSRYLAGDRSSSI